MANVQLILLYLQIFAVLPFIKRSVAAPMPEEDEIHIEDYENYYNEIDVNDEDADAKTRNALQSPLQRWPDRTLYYKIANTYTSEETANIHKALEFFNITTCLTFKEFNPEEANRRYIFFNKSENMCGTKVGYDPNVFSGPHNVVLSPYCLKHKGIIQHETLHVLGLFHEQSRPDREKYLHVEYANIPRKFWSQFMMVPAIYSTTYDVPYDYESLMHYTANAFAKDPLKPTMRAKEGKTLIDRKMGQDKGPAAGDLEKINIMYKCKESI